MLETALLLFYLANCTYAPTILYSTVLLQLNPHLSQHATATAATANPAKVALLLASVPNRGSIFLCSLTQNQRGTA